MNEREECIESHFKRQFVIPRVWEPIFYQSAQENGAWPVITDEFPECIQHYRWGLIPKWVKSMEEAEKIQAFAYNAKAETVFDKPTFAASAKYSHCLVPVSGFFYWQQEAKEKVAYHICLENNSPFCLAGIWSSWIHKETEHLYHTFSILTTHANSEIEAIGNAKKRMPLILPQERERDWLKYRMSKAEAQEFFMPYDAKRIKIRKVDEHEWTDELTTDRSFFEK